MTKNASLDIDRIYIVHGITGYETREKLLNESLGDQFGFDYEFVTESRLPSENDSWIAQYFVSDIRDRLRKGALLCTMVHFLIYERFLKSNMPFAVVFENDVCFLGDFPSDLKPIVAEARELKPGFMISLENSTLQFPSRWETKNGQHLYQAMRGRCAGAYLIDRRAAEVMLGDLRLNKCAKVIDWWHNELVDRKLIRMYWAHPPITEQGSFNGKLLSSFLSRSAGTVRRWRWLLQKFYKMQILTWFKSSLR